MTCNNIDIGSSCAMLDLSPSAAASPADFGFNKANMACSVLGEEVLMTGDLDPSATLGIVGSRIAERQYQVSLVLRIS